MCPLGTYNASFGVIICFEHGYYDRRMQTDVKYVLPMEILKNKGQCLPCDDECVRCEQPGEVLMKPGYGLSNTLLSKYEGLQRGPWREKNLFKCSTNMAVCAGEHDTDENQTATATAFTMSCPRGHRGPLCQQL